MIKEILKFFDKLEDKIRSRLSHYPIIYALIGGIGVVLFWRGVWYIADAAELSGIAFVVISIVLLLLTGVFVSAFIGNRLIISGLHGEKKLTEKAKEEIQTEEAQLKNMQSALNRLETRLDHIDEDHHSEKKSEMGEKK